ncbi:MAG: hypothetical protein EOO73_21265 [Myxococcales bacterium]|nr:MAG: hypothetical protein EOO73_21265 [Myxococcales bacterium]
MLRPVSLVTLGLALGACTPDVELARYSAAGGSAGTEALGGTGGSPSSGSGGVAPEGGANDGGGGPALPEARILADSVADFSLTQGEHGWYYGSDSGDVADFTQLGRIDTITAFMPPTKDVWDCWASENTHWTQIFRLGAHPNGTDTSPPSDPLLERAVRRWVSNYEGDVIIRGEVAKIDLVDSNGVLALVYVDGVQVYSTIIGGDDGAGLAYQAEASLRVGSNVDFVLDPRDGDDHHDLSRFTGIVARTATPPAQ